MTLQKAILKVSADADGDGVKEDGEFHMVGNLQITPGLRTGFIVGGRGSTVNAVVSSLLAEGESKRQGFWLDLGGGQHAIDIEFTGWEGAIDENGNPVQWGNEGSADAPTKTDATGADPITQIDVLMRYLIVAEVDSRNPATLEYGEFSTNGLFEPLDVVIEGPNFTRAGADGDWFDGTLTCITAEDVREVFDAIQRTG